MTPDPVITDADAVFVLGHLGLVVSPETLVVMKIQMKRALSAILKARVPDARSGSMEDEYVERAAEGFNACREAVLRGKP